MVARLFLERWLGRLVAFRIAPRARVAYLLAQKARPARERAQSAAATAKALSPARQPMCANRKGPRQALLRLQCSTADDWTLRANETHLPDGAGRA